MRLCIKETANVDKDLQHVVIIHLCNFTVSEKPNKSIGDLGSSDRRNAQRTSAAFMKMEWFATCCPGQILCNAG